MTVVLLAGKYTSLVDVQMGYAVFSLWIGLRCMHSCSFSDRSNVMNRLFFFSPRMFKSHMFSHYCNGLSASVASVSVTDMWFRKRLLSRLWNASRVFHGLTVRWWSLTVFLDASWSCFCNWVHYSPTVGLNYFDGLGCVVYIIEYSCNMEGAFLHFVLSFSIDQCRRLRSGSLVVFTVSASWGGRMPHGYRMHRVCRITWVFCGSNSWSSQKGRFLWRLTFSYRGYTDIDIDAPT